MPKIDLTHEILEVLSDAADEIADLSSPDNEVCQRLRELLRQITPRSVTVGELARHIDVSPLDVLDAAIAAGVKPFWHEGQHFREANYLRTYLRLESPANPVPELEFELTADLTQKLAEKLSVTIEELQPDSEVVDKAASVPRRFIASDTHWPGQAATEKRRDQLG